MDIELELRKAHAELQELYRGKSTNTVRINQLWNRINTLEAYKADGDKSNPRRVTG